MRRLNHFNVKIDNIIKDKQKCWNILLVLGDYNAKIGEGRGNLTVGHHEFGTRNEGDTSQI